MRARWPTFPYQFFLFITVFKSLVIVRPSSSFMQLFKIAFTSNHSYRCIYSFMYHYSIKRTVYQINFLHLTTHSTKHVFKQTFILQLHFYDHRLLKVNAANVTILTTAAPPAIPIFDTSSETFVVFAPFPPFSFPPKHYVHSDSQHRRLFCVPLPAGL